MKNKFLNLIIGDKWVEQPETVLGGLFRGGDRSIQIRCLIIDFLSHKDRTMEEISKLLLIQNININYYALSYHLRELVKLGLLGHSFKNRKKVYSVKNIQLALTADHNLNELENSINTLVEILHLERYCPLRKIIVNIDNGKIVGLDEKKIIRLKNKKWIQENYLQKIFLKNKKLLFKVEETTKDILVEVNFKGRENNAFFRIPEHLRVNIELIERTERSIKWRIKDPLNAPYFLFFE